MERDGGKILQWYNCSKEFSKITHDFEPSYKPLPLAGFGKQDGGGTVTSSHRIYIQ